MVGQGELDQFEHCYCRGPELRAPGSSLLWRGDKRSPLRACHSPPSRQTGLDRTGDSRSPPLLLPQTEQHGNFKKYSYDAAQAPGSKLQALDSGMGTREAHYGPPITARHPADSKSFPQPPLHCHSRHHQHQPPLS